MAETQPAGTHQANTAKTTDENSNEKVINDLGRMTPGDFAIVVTKIPGAAEHVPDQVDHLQRVAALVRFVESSTGPGIGKLKEIVEATKQSNGSQNPDGSPRSGKITFNFSVGCTVTLCLAYLIFDFLTPGFGVSLSPLSLLLVIITLVLIVILLLAN